MPIHLGRTLNRPSAPVFIISLILALLALLALLAPGLPIIGGRAVLFLAMAYVLLLIGVLVRGL